MQPTQKTQISEQPKKNWVKPEIEIINSVAIQSGALPSRHEGSAFPGSKADYAS